MSKHERIATPDLMGESRPHGQQHRSPYYRTPEGDDVILVSTPVMVQDELVSTHAEPGMVVAYDSDFDQYLVQSPHRTDWARDTCLSDTVPILVYNVRQITIIPRNFGELFDL